MFGIQFRSDTRLPATAKSITEPLQSYRIDTVDRNCARIPAESVVSGHWPVDRPVDRQDEPNGATPACRIIVEMLATFRPFRASVM